MELVGYSSELHSKFLGMEIPQIAPRLRDNVLGQRRPVCNGPGSLTELHHVVRRCDGSRPELEVWMFLGSLNGWSQ